MKLKIRQGELEIIVTPAPGSRKLPSCSHDAWNRYRYMTLAKLGRRLPADARVQYILGSWR